VSRLADTAVRAAVAQIPFGEAAIRRMKSNPFKHGTPLTMHVVAAFLVALAEVLQEHVKRCDAEHRELLKLQQDIAGMRRIFGTGDGGGL
jgi:hypothetical protein